MDKALSYYQDGRLEGITITIEAILVKKGLEVNRANMIKVLKKLGLDNYIEHIVNAYFVN